MRTRSLGIASSALIVAFLFALPAFAIVSGTGFRPIEEVPIERLLQNIERNRSKVSAVDYWLALGRLHLLAYIRQTKTLPAVTFGREGDEVADDGPFIGCKPIAPLPTTPVDKRVGTRRHPYADNAASCTTNDRQYDYPARPGLPEGTLAVRHPADDHLGKSVDAYERVKTLSPVRIRPRLALAYAYDRSGKIDKALVELRYIIDSATAALSKLPFGGTREEHYWDYQIVAAEAVLHLTMISQAKEDVARIRNLRPKLKTPERTMLYITPIFVPLTEADGMQAFVNRSAKVRFDLTGQGLALEGGWITKDAAWLVWDPHDQRTITSGFQLFGSVTWLTPWENGYLALAALDDNGDGKIAGAELTGLSLWRDENANGVSEKGEVKPVADWRIVSLGYDHRRHGKDAWISKNGVTFANGKTRPTFDWIVRTRLVHVATAKGSAAP